MDYSDLTIDELKQELQAIRVTLRNVSLQKDEKENLEQEAESIEEMIDDLESNLTFTD